MKLFLSLLGISTKQFKSITNDFDCLVDGYHVDIMDGLFVKAKSPSLSTLFNELKGLTLKPLWIHLMTVNPLLNINELGSLCQSTTSFHIETREKITDTIIAIKEKSGKPSLAINPKTPIFDLQPFVSQVEHITLMSVNPGASGQKFIPNSIARLVEIQRLYNLINNRPVTIGCDGGVNQATIASIKATGALEAVLSSAIFSYTKRIDQVKALQKIRSLT